MAQYNITAPDGTKYQVNAPDDATQDQVMAYVQAQHAPAAAQSPQNGLQLSVNPNGATQLPQQQIATPQDAIGTSADFASALGHHLGNLGIGPVQLAGHAVTSGLDAALPQGNAVRQYGDQARANMDAYISDREKQYQANTPTNAMSLSGAAIGEVAPWLVGAGEIGTGTKLATMMGKSALLGGLGGAATPVTDQGNYWRDKGVQVGSGAVIGAAVPPVAKAIGAGTRGVSNLAQYVTNPSAVADRAIVGAFGADAAPALRAGAQADAVPGAMPTAAQVLGGPQAVATERTMRSAGTGAQFINADTANDAARLAHLQQFAGTPETLEAAKQARNAVTQPFMDANINYLTPAQRWGNAGDAIQQVLDNPSRMPSADTDALRQAQKIAQQVKSGAMQEDDATQALNELGESVSTQKAQAAMRAAQQATTARMADPKPVLDAIALARKTTAGQDNGAAAGLDALRNNILKEVDTNGNVPLSVLEGQRANLGANMRAASRAAGGNGTRLGVASAPVKDALVNTLTQSVPDFPSYLANYARASEPINTQSTLQDFLNPAAQRSLNIEGEQGLTATKLSRLLQDVDSSDFGISPQARQAVADVHQSLLTASKTANKVGASGSNTDADMGRRLQNMLVGDPYSTAPGNATRALGMAVGGHLGGFPGAALGELATEGAVRAAKGRVVPLIGQRAANAQLAADAIQRATAPSYASRLLPDWMRNLPVNAGMLSGASYPARRQ